MTSSFFQLFLMNLRVLYRNRTGLFFTLVMPLLVYCAVSVLPVGTAIGGGSARYSSYVLPGMVALTIMQSGIYSLAYWMVEMKTRGVIKRFLVTPISRAELALSLVGARLLVVVVQMVMLTAAGLLLFHASFSGNPLLALLLAALGGTVFLLIGLLITTFAGSYEAAAPITSAVGLPFTFLGNIFYPTDRLPGFLGFVAKLLPITPLAEGLRQVYLSNPTIGDISGDIFKLLIWLVVMLVLVLWRFKLREE